MKAKVNVFWAVIAGLVILGSLALIFLGGRQGVIYVQSEQNPQEVKVRFFRALADQNYPQAYACLENYSGLGLENEPRDEDAARILETLRYQYSARLDGACVVRGDTAVQKLSLRVLDLDAVEAALATGPRLDEAGQVMVPALTLDDVLGQARSYTHTGDYELKLHFDGQNWRIVLEDDMLAALSGRPGRA